MAFSVVIPSASASNLIACVHALRSCEPKLPASKILVVDDGARTAATERLPVTWIPGAQPFIYARNVNLGIAAADDEDVILLNDDARLLTWRGFTNLAAQVRFRATVGACSAAIRGVVCNRRQLAGPGTLFRAEPNLLAFICVYLPRAVINLIGPFDERFVGYGFEDFDYCTRIREAGLELAVWDGCVVDHTGQVPSTFRSRRDFSELLDLGRELYTEKWGGPR